MYSFKEELGLLPWHTTEGLPLTFPQPCICMQVGCFNEEEVVVGLTDRNRLFFNEKEVCWDMFCSVQSIESTIKREIFASFKVHGFAIWLNSQNFHFVKCFRSSIDSLPRL